MQRSQTFHEPEGRARHTVCAAAWQWPNGAQGTDAPYRAGWSMAAMRDFEIGEAFQELDRRSADFQSAVSPICNRQSVEKFQRCRLGRSAAECNSAIQQITNLRYVNASRVHGPMHVQSGWKLSMIPRVLRAQSALPLAFS